MAKEAYYCTVKELNKLGRDAIPAQLRSNTHLIYSSPATLAFNSPGAEGFGVKRAGLAVPDSIMLIVAPGCCGRNTSLISSMREYDNRFFYLMMDETDIVTGRHLKKIPKAVEEICNCCEKRPSVVMICITCVDALLGTDMERVCRKAEERAGLPVRPCYMYALTREGRKPPMVHVRQSLYSLLEPKKKKGNVVNLLGFFSPLIDECELYDLLHSAGVKTIHEISRCKDYEEYQTMSEANFNLVLHPEARFAAEDFHNRLQIPFIELRRLYQTDKIASQYQAFGKVLGVTFSDEVYREKAEETVAKFKEKRPEASFAIGECMNGDPFEMALAMIKYGFKVPEIYGTLTAENLKKIAEVAEKYGDGYVHLTSRQGVEIPFIKLDDIDDVKDDLAKGGCKPGVCGPRVRTVTACQGNAVCPSGNINSYDIAVKLNERYFGRELPHKFKFGVTGCQNNCLKAEENDVGIKGAAQVSWKEDACIHCGVCEKACRENAISFEDDKLVIDTEKCNYCGRCAKSCPVDAWDVNEAYIVSFGGTFGNHISKGQEFLPLITSEEQLFRVTDAAIQFFDDHANPGERFKFTIDRVGAEKLQEVLKGAYNG